MKIKLPTNDIVELDGIIKVSPVIDNSNIYPGDCTIYGRFRYEIYIVYRDAGNILIQSNNRTIIDLTYDMLLKNLIK